MTRRVLLDAEHRAAIVAHARATYPEECCGFLVGTREDGALRVVELARATNAREDSPANRYLIPPEEFARVQRDADRRGYDIVGFYHSHPDAPARPSEFDRAHAWADYAYLIASVLRGEPAELNAFELTRGLTGNDTGSAFVPMELGGGAA
ncbi:MAG: Mov34/MPN/PAD-1 family protein [Candidatus Eiseniibacteriota bacterium]